MRVAELDMTNVNSIVSGSAMTLAYVDTIYMPMSTTHERKVWHNTCLLLQKMCDGQPWSASSLQLHDIVSQLTTCYCRIFCDRTSLLARPFLSCAVA